MTKLFMLLLAVCLLPAIVSAFIKNEAFMLKGCVSCDTCRCGYETDASQKMPNAVVRVECRNKDTGVVTYYQEAVTDSKGEYTMLVHSDRGDDCCDAVLVKSGDPECSTPASGRDKARVILTRNNGMTSPTRHANTMMFEKNTALASCPQILQKYQEPEE